LLRLLFLLLLLLQALGRVLHNSVPLQLLLLLLGVALPLLLLLPSTPLNNHAALRPFP